MAEASDNGPGEPSPPSSSVAHSVLGTFFKALAEKEGYADVAQRLKDTVLEKESFAEAAIKAAIFGGDQS